MRYFLVSLALSLRRQVLSKRFWLLLVLTVSAGLFLRWAAHPDLAAGAVQVGVVLPDGGREFLDALEQRSGAAVEFVPADEMDARRKVASSQWDCALVLTEDFDLRLETADLGGAVTLLTGPGSTVYPLVRETAAAVLLELATAQIAADYLVSSGISAEIPVENLPQPQHVRIEMETLDGRPLDQLQLAEESYSRIFRGVIAAGLLVWMLFAAVDAGRWMGTGAARRMRPGLGNVVLVLPKLTAAMGTAFLFGIAGILSSGASAGGPGTLALGLYLLALEAADLLLVSGRGVWTALPAVIPFAAVSVFVLSPVFVDLTLFFPQLGPLAQWLPVTLFLQGGEGSFSALGRLLVLTGICAGMAVLWERFRRYGRK